MRTLMGYIFLGGILIAFIALLYLPVYFYLRPKIPLIRQLCFVALAGILFVILFATILIGITFNSQIHLLNLIPFQWLRETWDMGFSKMVSQVIGNILMFVPLGFFLPVVFPQMRIFYRTALCVFLLTFSIEFIQYFIGRACDIDDLLQNLTGGVLGYLIYMLFAKILGRTKIWKQTIGEI